MYAILTNDFENLHSFFATESTLRYNHIEYPWKFHSNLQEIFKQKTSMYVINKSNNRTINKNTFYK